MLTPFEKLNRLLNLEISKNYDNRAVIGGLEKFIPTWEAETKIDGLDQNLVTFVSKSLSDYAKRDDEARVKIIHDLLECLKNNQITLEITKPISIAPTKQNDSPANKRNQPNSDLSSNSSTIRQKSNPKPAISESIPGLNAPLTVLSGIGAARAQTLKQLGLNTLGDVLYYFPRRYDDYSKLKPINRINYGDEITVIAVIQSVQTRKARGGSMQITEAIVTDGTGTLRLTWFNNPYIEKQLPQGTQIVVSGKVDMYLGRYIMNHPSWEPLEKEHLHTNRIVPVYPLTANITQRTMRSMIFQIVNHWATRIPEFIPDRILKNVGLINLSKAISQIHFPESDELLNSARNRLAFDEIFLMQLGVMQQKQNWQGVAATKYSVEDNWIQKRIDALPYKLTGAQTKSLADIHRDLSSGHPMNRLLQGDVGSGKTIIASFAIGIVSIAGNAQSAFLAPTSILAVQHYRTLKYTLCRNIDSETDLTENEICLLIGNTPEPEKVEIRQKLADGKIKVLIGTHALLQDPVVFKNLQLVIIDEQHRFGIEQRAILRSKGNSPHLMVMTATPIPRSLALTLYGDLDISVIDEMPTGRLPVETHVLFPAERERAYTLIKNQVELGFQSFIIYPLIEKNDKEEAKAAIDEQERLQKEVFPNLKIGLLHGRMKQEEKDRIMQEFRDKKYPILVSTTVIEVGVDIPNATVMLIEGANRFGLAQLHQLRGRVGRSDIKSYCLLIPETDDQVENERLSAMVETNNGFILAERDLQQRGPGEFLGERQSGFAQFKMASITDIHLIEKAREQAQSLFEIDPDLTAMEHQSLRNNMEYFWSNKTGDIS
jgi:ATP-dependent DNA helicase RecG